MKRTFFNEVAPRVGFQIEPGFIPTDSTVAPVDAMSLCGHAKIADAMGNDTGMDLDQVLALARQMAGTVGHEVPGQVAKAGRSTDLHPVPAVRL